MRGDAGARYITRRSPRRRGARARDLPARLDPSSLEPSAASRSRKRIVRGILCAARRAAQNCRTASVLIASSLASATMHATICWPRRASGAATTRTSATPGIARSTCSTSSGCTFRPATFTNAETRPRSVRRCRRVPCAVVAGQKPVARRSHPACRRSSRRRPRRSGRGSVPRRPARARRAGA